MNISTGKRILILGGSVLLAKGLYLLVHLLSGSLAPEAPVVMGAIAETFIGIGIVLSDLIEPILARHPRPAKPALRGLPLRVSNPKPLVVDFNEDDAPQF